jgi:hypothetical protein
MVPCPAVLTISGEKPMRLLSLLAAALLWTATGVQAESVSFDSCSDASGRPVNIELVHSLPKLVQIAARHGQALIQYNPELLPNASAMTKQFFYAQACASVGLGHQSGMEPALANAKRADCVAVRTLRLSGLLTEEETRSLQRELSFTGEEWEQLPGPRRNFELAACAHQAGIRIPSTTTSTPGQNAWNACIRECSDRLFHCQRNCSTQSCADSCLKTHQICETGCNGQ